MPPQRLLMQKAYDTRIPLPHIRHFERKREIFFVRGKTKAVRGTASGKHPAPCAPKKRCFMQTAPRRKKNTANEKDPSVALGMTVLGERMVSRGGGIAAFLEEGILISTT